MNLKLSSVLLLVLLFLNSCFENEQGLYSCEVIKTVAEEMPKLEGGIANLQQQVVFPEEAREAGVEGRVTVKFVVDKIGRVLNPQVTRGIGMGADEEAIRVVKNSKWEPAREKGEPVCIEFALSLNFRLQNE